VREYKITSGIIGRQRRLILAADYVEYENIDLEGNKFTRLDKADIKDFRYGTGDIMWYKYVIGEEFSVTLKDQQNHELRIVLENYFNLHKGFKELYTDIVNDIWSLYHSEVVDALVERFHTNEEISIQDISIQPKGVKLKEETLLPWERVRVNEYNKYFTIYDDDNPVIHSRINFNEYGTETLWCTLRTILKEKKEKAAQEIVSSK
jgi:hypothetical protein